ncbi:MAG TPA: putative lipid II flippase FtsW [Spirochaetota bacterium]
MDLKGVIDTRRKERPDLILFITILVLAGLGLAMIYSASAALSLKYHGTSFYFLKKQLIWFIAGFGALLLFQEIDYRHYPRVTIFLLGGAMILLISVFVPGLGHHAKGSARWIGMGELHLQPSEFVKIVMVIYLAKVFSAEQKDHASHAVSLIIPIVVLAVMFIMVMLQPDFGTAIDLLLVSVAIMFASGFSLIYLMVLGVISIPAFYLLIYQVKYRWDRVIAYFNPWHDRFGIGYHIIQSFTAFRIGGFLGVGLGYGTMKLARLPEPHTDFIFAVIGEEAGFFGTASVIILFALLFWRGIRISLDATDNFGRLLSMGLTLMIVMQAFLNIAVVTGSLPTTGIPLPFISYGGSSFLSNMITCGILLNISRYREAVHEGFKYDNFGSEEVWQ